MREYIKGVIENVEDFRDGFPKYYVQVDGKQGRSMMEVTPFQANSGLLQKNAALYYHIETGNWSQTPHAVELIQSLVPALVEMA